MEPFCEERNNAKNGKAMLGLPSTTEVGRRLPKEALYRNLKLTPKQKDAFVHGVERIVILSYIKESTIHIPAGSEVEEIMVVGIELRDEGAAKTVVDEIGKANKYRLAFLCQETTGRASLAVRARGVKLGPWTQPDQLTLEVWGDTLDAVWDAIVSQVAYGDTGASGERLTVRKRRRPLQCGRRSQRHATGSPGR